MKRGLSVTSRQVTLLGIPIRIFFEVTIYADIRLDGHLFHSVDQYIICDGPDCGEWSSSYSSAWVFQRNKAYYSPDSVYVGNGTWDVSMYSWIHVFSFEGLGNYPKFSIGNNFVSADVVVHYVFDPFVPCEGDLNYDLQVDDADFQMFVVAYDVLDCADEQMLPGCPSDLAKDGLVDDQDFQLFVVAYDNLLCPE